MRRLIVKDYTFGRKETDDVNTSVPFKTNLAECRTVQQANVVISAYTNKNYEDMQNKVDKEDGKGLSTNDFTDEDKTKLDDLKNYTAGTGIEITDTGVINNTQTSAEWGSITGDIDDQTDLKNALDSKQATLIGSGENQNIKTINNENILGSGNINVSASSVAWGNITGSIANQNDLNTALSNKLSTTDEALSGGGVAKGISDRCIFNNNGIGFETSLVTDSNFGKLPTSEILYASQNKELITKAHLDNDLNTVNTKIDNLLEFESIETDTGKLWIDGKKIYRKCFSNPASTTTFDHGISDLGEITDYGGTVLRNENVDGGTIQTPFPALNADPAFSLFFNFVSKTKIYLVKGNNIQANTVKIWLEYTKSS